MWTIDPHPDLRLLRLEASWPRPLGEESPDWLKPLGHLDAKQPFEPPDDAHKQTVRDLLRHGGFKPAGRSKPCWEYLTAMTRKGRFPWINPAVDATNLAALHGALPISTIDCDKVTGPFRVALGPAGASYVFNRSGQTIDVTGLVCLFDQQGPCANPVKDAQRSKTDGATRRTLTLVWGTQRLPERTDTAAQWLRELFERCGAEVVVT